MNVSVCRVGFATSAWMFAFGCYEPVDSVAIGWVHRAQIVRPAIAHHQKFDRSLVVTFLKDFQKVQENGGYRSQAARASCMLEHLSAGPMKLYAPSRPDLGGDPDLSGFSSRNLVKLEILEAAIQEMPVPTGAEAFMNSYSRALELKMAETRLVLDVSRAKGSHRAYGERLASLEEQDKKALLAADKALDRLGKLAEYGKTTKASSYLRWFPYPIEMTG